jgi:hypothetical protein
VENSKIQFVLEGFTEVQGSRVFTFEGVASDRTRTALTVKADLTLVRKYGIRLQELPLLCRAVAERNYLGGKKRTFAYTEDEMQQYAAGAAARDLAARMRRPPRQPGTSLAGNAAAAGANASLAQDRSDKSTSS